jgi:glucose dehydrogenase
MIAQKTIPFLVAACIVFGQQTRRVDDNALKSAGKAGDEWLTYGLTQGETRYSPLNQINTTNVSRLTPGCLTMWV